MALAREQHDVARFRFRNGGGDRLSPVADLARLRSAGKHRLADRRGVLGAWIVVGDDHHIAQPRRDLAHRRALAFVAIAARAENGDQPARDMGPKRGNRRSDRIGGVGIVDIDRRACGGDHRALEPPSNRGNAAHPGQGGRPVAAGGEHKSGRDQHIGGLIGADQRQGQLEFLAVMRDDQLLAERARLPRHQTDRVAALAHREQFEAAAGGARDHLVGPRIVGPHHRRRAIPRNVVEQPHLGREIIVHVGVVIEVIAAEIGEGHGFERHPLGAILVEAVRRRFVGDVADPHPLEPGDVRQEGDDVGGGQPGLDLVVGGGDPQCPDRGRAMPRQPPQLADHFDGRGLAVGPGDRDHRRGEWREESGGQVREQFARFVGGEVRCAIDNGRATRDHRDRAAADRVGDEILAVEAASGKRPEDIARRDLAMVEREPGYDRIPGGIIAGAGELAKAHGA